MAQTGTQTQDGTRRATTAQARLLMLPIAGYRRFVSPFLPPRCRFAPSCSEYALTALAEYGAKLRDAAVAAGEPVRKPSERRRGARRRIR